MSKITEEQGAKILRLKEEGLTSRMIAKAVLGSEGKKSTVNDYVARNLEYPTNIFTVKLTKAEEDSLARKSSFKTMVTQKYAESEKDNSIILLISDMHIPYHHKDTFAFLQHLKDKYSPTRIICMGDELDKHSLSFHDSDPDLGSAGDELARSLPFIAQLYKMFPEMDILDSNHGSLVYRKAKHHGIPRNYMKSYNEVLQVGDSWQWHFDMTIDLPDGNQCYLHHGKSSNVQTLSQQMGMCAAQGHFHNDLRVSYWANPNGLFWGLQTGCLIDDNSLAFNYNNVLIKRPIIGTALIVDSMPVLEPMVLSKNGSWVGLD